MTGITPTTPHELQRIHPQPLDRNPAAVYLAGLTEGGRRTQRNALDTIAGILTGGAVTDCLVIDWAKVRFQHAAAIRARLVQSYKPATANRMLTALRGTLKAAWRLGLITAEELARAQDVASVRGETVSAGHGLTPADVAAIMAICEVQPSPNGERNAAIFAVVLAAGLRRAEVIRLDLGDYDPTTGALLVHGKGSKERITYIDNGAAEALADWLLVRGNDSGPLFLAVNKTGKIRKGQRLTAQAFFNLLKRLADAAGVRQFSPHDLRRTFVSNLLDAGADIATVAKMAGHASVNTTARYDRRPEQAKQKAAGMVHIPYHRRRSND